ncbi:hypothetical protein M422DRAFT_242112 [Sphaerobolus stellatus SS14]|nr:hypothetical protein M422DRAFT_242112 [Sphaerobolus stellatus SS14]
MHKELNTVKGGYSEVAKYWERNGIDGPIALPNKDAAVAVAGGVEPAKPIQGGAVKAMSLAGAVFNHKDDKKGEKDSIRYTLSAPAADISLTAHMEKILANPMLLLASDANFEDATLDGKPWVRPEVMYAIWRLAPTLPHLKGLTVAFFTSALETWRRFITEYAPGGLIATASSKLHALAWMPTTNDVNEGALGSRRVIKQSYPKTTELTLNAQQRYRWNKT